MITFYDKYGQPMDGTDDWIELQWNRRYYSAGDWVLYMPARIYNPDWKYIQIQDRPEWGMVQKWQFEKKAEGDFMTLSGFFTEKALDWGGVFFAPYETTPSTNTQVRSIVATELRGAFPLTVLNPPEAMLRQGSLGLLRAYTDNADASKYPTGANLTVEGNKAIGEQLQSIFQTIGYSMRCIPSWGSSESRPLLAIRAEFWQGNDKRNSVFFGSAWNDVRQINYTLDESGAYCDVVVIQELPEDDTTWSASHYYVTFTGESGEVYKCLVQKYHVASNQHSGFGDSRPTCYVILNKLDKPYSAEQEADILMAMETSARKEVQKKSKVENISVDIIQNTFIYGVDYDLGDICTVSIDEIQQQFVARIVEVHEVYSKNQKNFQIVLGTPSKTNYRRIIT